MEAAGIEDRVRVPAFADRLAARDVDLTTARSDVLARVADTDGSPPVPPGTGASIPLAGAIQLAMGHGMVDETRVAKIHALPAVLREADWSAAHCVVSRMQASPLR